MKRQYTFFSQKIIRAYTIPSLFLFPKNSISNPQAKEAEDERNVAQVLVHVAVMDVNDNEPVFVGQPYYALVSTTAARGHVVTKVRRLA